MDIYSLLVESIENLTIKIDRDDIGFMNCLIIIGANSSEKIEEFINDYLKITGANILNDERSMLQDEIFFEFLNEKAIVSDDILKGFYFDNDFIGS